MAKLVAIREASRARQIVGGVLAERLARDFPGMVGELAFVPTYTVAFEKGGTAPRIIRAGWRFFWLAREGRDGAIVELSRTLGKRARLVGYSKGRWSESFLKRLASAREHLRSVEGSFRPRLLTVPSIHCEALWLHDARRPQNDRFFNLADGREFPGPFQGLRLSAEMS